MRAIGKPRVLSVLASVGMSACLALAPVTAAQGQDPAPGKPRREAPGEMARESLDQLMRALRLLMESIPQYELPEVMDNGDIIIRRKDSKRKPGPEEPEMDETST